MFAVLALREPSLQGLVVIQIAAGGIGFGQRD